MLQKESSCISTVKFQCRSEFHSLEPALHPSVTDIVKDVNTLIQERQIHSENFITVKVSRRTLKVEIYLGNEGSGFAFFSMDLGHIFGSFVAMNSD